MATKDHSLDGKIVSAAQKEFMEYGFQKASINRIAKRAGVTTGAIYTRYDGKDNLFCSLVSEALTEISAAAEPLRELYYKAMETRKADDFLLAMRQEQKLYLDLIFRYYDASTLLFCKSEGSSLSAKLAQTIEAKGDETAAFFQSIAKQPVSANGIKIIIAATFDCYRLILSHGYSRDEAAACMRTVEMFFETGWEKLFAQCV